MRSTYRNTSAITCSSGSTKFISDITYKTSRGGTCIYNQEVTLTAEPVDASSQMWFYVHYYVRGKKINMIKTSGSLVEGINLINLSNFWKNGKDGTYRLRVRIYPENCNITINKNDSSAYLFVKDGDADDFQLVVSQEPDKTEYYPGESLDYTGLVILKEYFDDKPSVDVTSDCRIDPPAGTEVEYDRWENTITCEALYKERDDIGNLFEYTVSFYCYLDAPDIEIPYLHIQSVDPYNNLIYIDGLLVDDIEQDRPSRIEMPTMWDVRDSVYRCVYTVHPNER